MNFKPTDRTESFKYVSSSKRYLVWITFEHSVYFSNKQKAQRFCNSLNKRLSFISDSLVYNISQLSEVYISSIKLLGNRSFETYKILIDRLQFLLNSPFSSQSNLIKNLDFLFYTSVTLLKELYSFFSKNDRNNVTRTRVNVLKTSFILLQKDFNDFVNSKCSSSPIDFETDNLIQVYWFDLSPKQQKIIFDKT